MFGGKSLTNELLVSKNIEKELTAEKEELEIKLEKMKIGVAKSKEAAIIDMKKIINEFLSDLSLGESNIYRAGNGSGLGQVQGALPCMQKLLPCQPYLSKPESAPPACCLPLKEMIVNEPACLCKIFNNPPLLKTLKINQEDALKLPKACGANADVSVCEKEASASTTSPTTPTLPSTPTTTTNLASTSTKANSTTTSSSVRAIALSGRYGFVTLCVSLVMSAF
ncbi:hypothetical protein GIB67_035072 [Kingdonia uniflora]|uniref:Bifunctional inhibitor/plant lipid transfer protein/seed storage helical domain-containing protein n=1 Tax=Kingdonia uniflora TaxID=39325 RepID=A0A7J7L1M6_9MAGN|nr:hypothetical protein GIB67_035072 [Kingdonia uniflora]